MSIFSLSYNEKSCDCGKTKGKYINNIYAEFTGNAQPIGFSNPSFRQGYTLQKIEDKKPKKVGECCKGVEFTAFFIPKNATSINKIEND
jgi:hypothetical protein